MKSKKLLILIIFLLLFSTKVYAQDFCSKNGYTVITVNGIFTDKIGAVSNSNKLKNFLPAVYNNQPITVDYIYNPTHLGGAMDLVDVIQQGLFDEKSDYDLVEILNDASVKVKTEKLLLVGHSQGNFYANNFYDKVVDKDGGVPSSSIGVYSVATPSNRVAGNGNYLTSDTDSVISGVVKRVKNIMTPNTHIDLQKNDEPGHSFSDVYLKYRSSRIVSDIKSSLSQLKENEIQSKYSLCISPQKISLSHRISGAIISSSDFIVNSTMNILTSLGSTITSLAKRSLASVGLIDGENSDISLITQPVVVDNYPEVNSTISIDQPQIDSSVESNNPDKIITDNNSIDNILDTNNNPSTPVILGGGHSGWSGTSIDNPTSTDISEPGSGNNSNNEGNTNNPSNDNSNPIIKDDTLDKNSPVITLLGEANMKVTLNTEYVDAGATAVDDVDGNTPVVTTGIVDTTKIGVYTITYTATDKANNTSTLNRIVSVESENVPDIIPTVSMTSTLTLPNSGDYAGDGLNPNRGMNNLTSFIFRVIYTDINNNAPQSIKLHVKNVTTGNSLSDISLTKVTQGENTLSDGNYLDGELYTTSQVYDGGDYVYSFSSTDKDGNFYDIKDDSNLRFGVIPSTYTYIPKYSFGVNNGDGNDWQVWAFNGSNIYDWTDTYVNNYLHEQFKIQAYSGGFWSAEFLQRGIFNHDPQKGFESSDLLTSNLESNPQNNMNGTTYSVVMQWDSTGYTYTISHDNLTDSTGHVDVPSMNNNMWVGWDGSSNNFKTFPNGSWVGVAYASPLNRTGGNYMILKPYPVYDSNAVSIPNPDPTPEPDPTPTPTLSNLKIINSFNLDGLTPVVNGVINNTDHTISLTVPYGTDIKTLIPTISFSEKATILPESSIVEDFTNPISYTVKAEDGSTELYIVTVIVSPNLNPVPDNSLPTIKSYTLNGSGNSLMIDPLSSDVTIILSANKKVNWVSIKIEKDNDPGVYKIFQSGIGCVDGTDTCTKVWNGILSKGGLLQSGNYRIKVHIKDDLNNEYDEYLPSVIIVGV